MPDTKKPTVAVWKFASCDGCQLSLLELEDEFLDLVSAITISDFKEATSAEIPGPYDVSLIEGSVTTPHDAERLKDIREKSKIVVAIGACATAGGIQALRNFKDVKEFTSVVYAEPSFIETLATSTPISDHIPVDLELRGCPVNKTQLLEAVSAILNGRRPNVSPHSVCMECKMRGTVCIMVQGTPCLGPVTHAGCGAICPAFRRGCYGCYGPSESPNTSSLARVFSMSRVSEREILRMFRTFNANAPAFRKESEAHER